MIHLNPDYALEIIQGGDFFGTVSKSASSHLRFFPVALILRVVILACFVIHAPNAKHLKRNVLKVTWDLFFRTS